jgi:hypothetical protein
MKTHEDIIDLVTEVIAAEWLENQMNPGIYRIIYDPDTETVYSTSTFSGDNSYIPNDNRITLASADIRESLSRETVGIDEDGDIIESDTYRTILDECERALDEAEYDG